MRRESIVERMSWLSGTQLGALERMSWANVAQLGDALRTGLPPNPLKPRGAEWIRVKAYGTRTSHLARANRSLPISFARSTLEAWAIVAEYVQGSLFRC